MRFGVEGLRLAVRVSVRERGLPGVAAGPRQYCRYCLAVLLASPALTPGLRHALVERLRRQNLAANCGHKPNTSFRR